MEVFNVFYLISICAVAACHSQQLTVEYSSVTLSHGEKCHSVHYDGDDSIYIFGSCSWETYLQEQYSLEGDNISSFGSPPTIFPYGSVQSDNIGNLFLFGTGHQTNQVIKYDVETNSTSLVATLPWNIAYCPTIQSCDSSQSSNTVFILGGSSSENRYKILSFDLQNYNINQSEAILPINLRESGVICVDGRAFVFPAGGIGDKNVWEFDFSTQILSPLEQTYLPKLIQISSLMSINGLIFVISGFIKGQNPPVASQEGLLRFDPTTKATDFVPVGNWPVKDGERYFSTAPQCVYVQKLARIYCFGGKSYNWTTIEYIDHDEIFYIDMSSSATTSSPTETTTEMSNTSLNPDWFSCTNKTDGFYPNPTDCTRFIGCRDEEMDHFECSPPNLFNPLTRTCDIPQNVDCEITCLDRPNGYYPHPHDCALYIVCHEGLVNIVKCPTPLLFDPEMLLCNYPENVVCRQD